MVTEPLEVSSPLLEVTVASSRGFFAFLDMMERFVRYYSPMDCGVVNYCVLCRCRLMKRGGWYRIIMSIGMAEQKSMNSRTKRRWWKGGKNVGGCFQARRASTSEFI